jgi:hypothetical protein
MLDEEKLNQIQGARLLAGSVEVGEIEEVFSHSSDNVPAVVAVSAEGRRVLVPLPQPEAQIGEGQVTVPFDAGTIGGAPEASGDTVAGELLTAVYDHYGIDDADMREDSTPGGTGRADQGMSRDPRSPDAADDAKQAHPGYGT